MSLTTVIKWGRLFKYIYCLRHNTKMPHEPCGIFVLFLKSEASGEQRHACVGDGEQTVGQVRAAHRAALGNGLSDVAISGLSEPAERMLEAVREKRFEGAFTADDLYNLVSDLLSDPAQLAQMAENMRAAGTADAAERIADLVLKLADRHGK